MSNTSTVHIKTDFDCKVYDYGQEIGTTKSDTYFNVELRKGEHELTFRLNDHESISKIISYIVEDVNCDYRLVVDMIDIVLEKATEQYDFEHYPSAFELFSLSANQGNATAQYYLGECYYYGHGVNEDRTKAVKWYTKAAEQGNACAQYNIASCYENGNGVNVDLDKALEWYNKAAESGDAYVQNHLGCCYEFGEFAFPVQLVEANPTKAVEWYTKAAEQGYALAQYNLGRCCEFGIGIEKNHVSAVSWYTKAAEQGHEVAQLHLGICYEQGIGVIKDLAKAEEWYTKASKYASTTAIEAQNRLKSIKAHKMVEKPVCDVIKYKNIHYLFFDTETTGLPNNYNAPTYFVNNWPRLVQLSWITTDEDCNILSKNDHIIYPDGFIIPEEASQLHGITTKIALDKGEPLEVVIDKFMEDFNASKIIVGHNISFDKKIIGAELIRLGKKDVMNSKESFCTMESSTDYCKIPGYRGYKWPKLQELHKKLFGYEFEDAHNSMCDINATLKCFKEMKIKGLLPIWQVTKTQNFTPEEIESVERTEIVPSQYGKSVCFHMKKGGVVFIPLMSSSSKNVGESIDMATAKILTLSRYGEADIQRVKD